MDPIFNALRGTRRHLLSGGGCRSVIYARALPFACKVIKTWWVGGESTETFASKHIFLHHHESAVTVWSAASLLLGNVISSFGKVREKIN